MRDKWCPLTWALSARACHDLEINGVSGIGQDIGDAALIMQAIFQSRLAGGETDGRRLRDGRRDAVDFTRRVIMRADFNKGIII